MHFDTREQYELYKMGERHREYMDALRPFIKAKSDAMALMMPERVMTRTGQMYTTWRTEDRVIIDQYDKLIRQVQKTFYGLSLTPSQQMAAGNHSIGVFRDGKLIATDEDVYAFPGEKQEQK